MTREKKNIDDIVAVIPMRGGSKGLPGKNTKWLLDRPMYRYAVDAALAAGVKNVCISTDIEEVLRAELPAGVRAIPRDQRLSRDTTPMVDVIDALIGSQISTSSTIILLQPTSPLRQAHQISKALELYANGEFDLVMSVVEKDRSILKCGTMVGNKYRPLGTPEQVFSNRQSLPRVVGPNGAIYIFEAGWFQRNGGFHSSSTGVYEMDNETSLDVDNETDFQNCKAALEALTNR